MNYLYDLNLEQQERNEIIGVSFVLEKSSGGLKPFLNLSISQLQLLLTKRFTLEEISGEKSPTIKQFLSFAQQIQQENPSLSISFDGYATDKFRWDYRVSVEAIKVRGNIDPETKSEFLDFVCRADDIEVEDNLLYAWFD